jgi:hypothetical protein
MSDDRDLQDWFKRSVEQLPSEPFALEVFATVRRRERWSQLQRYAALVVVFSCLCLLLSALATPLEVVMTVVFACWVVKQMRDPGFTRGLLLRALQALRGLGISL